MPPDDEISVGCRVRLSGLQSAPRMNGKTGIIESWTGDRWVVTLDTTNDDTTADAPSGDNHENSTITKKQQVKIRPVNCTAMENEESRLQQAVASHDRNTIRAIMTSRQTRSVESTASNHDTMTNNNNHKEKTSEEEVTKDFAFDSQDFSCPICRNLLHKPCINASCGHAFCFWCLHTAMNDVGKSSCPLCRTSYSNFAAPFQPLYRFLQRAFPEETQQREKEIIQQEQVEFHAQSPQIQCSEFDETEQPYLIGDDKIVDVMDLLCSSCHNVVHEPVVPSCGHLICKGCCTISKNATDTNHGNSECPECKIPILLNGSSDGLKVCSVLKPILDRIRNEMDETAIEKVVQESSTRKGVKQQHRQQSVLDGIQLPDIRSESKEDFVHFGVGCDGCGQYPMTGHAFRCLDCPEEIGYDLCKACFLRGIHLQSNTGRFNQSHKASHTFEEREQLPTFFHQLMAVHPNLTPAQIMQFVQFHAPEEEEEQDEDG